MTMGWRAIYPVLMYVAAAVAAVVHSKDGVGGKNQTLENMLKDFGRRQGKFNDVAKRELGDGGVVGSNMKVGILAFFCT